MLEAAIENTLYHACHVNSAASIISEKKFRLTIAIGTDADNAHQNGKIYFLSTARSRYNRYIKGSLEGAQTGVVLNLDKSILQQNSAIKPVDYWAWGPDQKETEDRVFSNKPIIDFKGKTLIQSVHLMFNKDFKSKYIHASLIDSISTIIKTCRKEGLKLYLYDNFKDFSVQNTAKSISISQYIELRKALEVEPRMFSGRGRPSGRGYILGALIELMRRPQKDASRLGDRAAKLRYEIVYGYWKDDMMRSIKNEIHNSKQRDRDIVIKLVEEMRRNKYKTLAAMVEALKEKWKTPIEG